MNRLHLFFCILFAACTDRIEENAGNDAPVIPVTILKTTTTALHRNYVGDLNANKNVEIRARVQGYLETIYVDEGKEVVKGQALFRLSSHEYKSEILKAGANVKEAIAEAKAAELELGRVRNLVQKGVVSSTELEVAQAKYDAVKAGIERAKSILDNANTSLSYTFIRSPFNGVVDRIPFKVGSLINEGDLLTSVSDIHSINAYFNVSEIEYLDYMKIKAKDPKSIMDHVQLKLADGSDYPHQGNIETMDGEFEENTGSIAFRAKFPNPDKILKHGSTGTIRLTSNMNYALLVPQKATFEIQDKTYVFVVNKNNQVKMRSFVPLTRFSDYYIVQSGLKAGDKVVFEGIQKIKDGMKIIPEMIEGESMKDLAALTE
jgi:membrane fusion protein (multidrug efflux system)